MKKLLLIVLFYLFSQVSSLANERDTRLNQLFNELKANKSKVAFIIEQEIWALWSTHPTDEKLTTRLEEGSKFVRDQNYIKAKDIFTEVINLDQNWAEAWNKRATVLYLMGKYELSQADIDKVLKIEKRHFGALTGQGLVQTALKNYQKAIDSYIEAHKVHPFMKSPMIMIEKLQIELQKQSI